MKVQIVIVALAALLLPVHGVLRQCAGTGLDKRYERSGFLTADFTQKACAASGGSIDPTRKGNQKCCNVPDSRQGDFNNSCEGQKAENFPSFRPTAQPC
ncbi:Hypothetical protein PHPALM_21206 [Phytophthora palmivora]|uniref:Uncharacterized protein n=1 Tax=Phytophthora palmivora TaxID=4796 RepID=A0A2P4XCY1_9STRA|nr:hypothetical protein PHPALM_29528 [Phytophthora palmivora]POM63402.1 Hypothetical protein PHPALM_21206 [Phytophthora palmivora]